MRSDIVKEFVAMIEAEAQNRPSPAEFEMAYQARVAMDRIRFAIKVTEMGTERCEPLREAGMQLLDALQGSKRQSADSRIDGVLRVIRSRGTPIWERFTQRTGRREQPREP